MTDPQARPPPPCRARGNEWRTVELPAASAFRPAHAVSVIVPCFNAPAELALTLAGLERQDWPAELLEVVVVDDGSEPPLAMPAASAFAGKLVRQERKGFGLARARNAGARAAAHDILVFLDADIIAEAGLVRAHARWHHAAGDVLTFGFCRSVSPEGIDARAIRDRPGPVAALLAGRAFDPPWFERHMARTGDFTASYADLFRAVTGNNFALSRALFDEAGGFDESFNRYGGEDTEFAYRAQLYGALLTPVREALGWHQGRWAEGRTGKSLDQERQAEKLAHLIAEPGFRWGWQPPEGGWTVARHAVTLDAGDLPAGRVAQAAAALLAGRAGDLAVYVEVAGEDSGRREELARRFAGEPRVKVGAPDDAFAAALDAFPASPLHLRAPAEVVIGWGEGAAHRIGRLGSALGDAALGSASAGQGRTVWAARAWALNRARRAGGKPDDYGAAVELPARWLRSAGAAPPANVSRGQRRPRGAMAVFVRIRDEARHVRGVRTGWRFLRWLAAAALWRLRAGRGWRLPRNAGHPAAVADSPLGVTVAAFGPRARATFAASSRIAHRPGADADVALADSAAEAAGARTPCVLLTHAPALAVPAFDPARDNPAGFVRDVEPFALALGDPALLPSGSKARRAAAPGARPALAHCHHIEDVAAFHPDPAARAAKLARIAARGTPVLLADRESALEALLGSELHALMREDIPFAGAAAREAASVAQRRAALRAHSLGARARQLCEAAGVARPGPPRISVLLATRRPALLDHAVANVARQRYPAIELVLALHGPGFPERSVEAVLARFAYSVKIVRVDARLTLGAALREATAAASGALLAKMDDDDLYGPEHLWDLALAHEYSGAALVGKFPATVYLARRDLTLRQRAVASETPSGSITGGAMLVSRAALSHAGGWRDLPRGVDKALVGDVLQCGEGVYRTHDAGYLLVRHGAEHTWERGDAGFLAGAELVRRGWRPELAGLAGAERPAVHRLRESGQSMCS